jgi:hypothetical protein
MEELRRERAQVLAEARGRPVVHPRPYHRAASTTPSVKFGRHLPRVTLGTELNGGWIHYCTAPRGSASNPLLVAIEGPRAGAIPPWDLRR